MSWLIVPVTVVLLRGAIAVLLLAGAESLGGDYLSARVRRALWVLCLFLMMLPQPHFSFQPLAIDLTAYREHVIRVADILPRGIAGVLENVQLAHTINDYSQAITGLSYQNYPYLLGMILMIVPALFLLLSSYLRGRKRTENFKEVQVLLAKSLHIQTQVFKVNMLFIRSNMSGGNRLFIKSDIFKRGKNNQLGVNVTALIIQSVVLASL